jgi:hypothetical protein
MIELFFVLLIKGQFYESMYSFATFCDGPRTHQGTAQYPANQETGFTSRAPMFEKS